MLPRTQACILDVVGEGEGVSVHADEVGDIANEAKGVSQDAIVRTGRVGKIEAQLPAAEIGGRGNSLVILGEIAEVQRLARRSVERREWRWDVAGLHGVRKQERR